METKEELYKQLKRLEQERDELQNKYSKLIHKYNDLYEKYRAQEILIPDLQEEIKRFDTLSIKYSQALEKIKKVINCSDKNDCDNCPRNDFCEELCDSKENLIYVLKTII